MRFLTLLLLAAALAAGQSRYARLGEFQGSVEVQLTAADPWIPAERNLPLPESAWVRTGGASRVEIEMDDGGDWRLGPDSQGEISDYTRLSTGQRITLLSLDHGTAYFSGQPVAKDVVMIAMPGAQVTILQGSRIRQTVQPGWSQVAVFEGQVRFSSPAAEMDLHEVTTARVEPANPSRFFLFPELTAEPLDRWSEDRDKVQTSPLSGAHVTARYGLADLDTAGKWLQTNDLGLVWKPDVPADWVPYRKGRWRYYDTLGYTWVADDSWGWLPYHNGRWAQKDNVGWVWQPAISTVFHPGEVYWQKGAGYAGWGPLSPADNGAATPEAYRAGLTTYAAFQPDARILSPEGFPTPAAEALKAATFVPALPSPAFLTARLDAVRPELRAGRTRVLPSIYGVTFGDAPAPDTAADTSAPPVTAVPLPVIPSSGDATPPPDDGTYALPIVAVPVPVVVEEIKRTEVVRKPSTATAAPPAKTPLPRDPVRGLPRPDPGRRRPVMTPEEENLYKQVLQDVNPTGPNYVKALADLTLWARRFPNTAFFNDRSYYYIHVYNNTGHPDKLLDTAEPLVAGIVANAYEDQQQVLQVLWASASSIQKLTTPTPRELVTGQNAARQLLEFLPLYFDPRHKPGDVTDAAWAAARTQLEAVARAALGKRPPVRTGLK